MPSINDSIIHLRKRHSSLEDKSLQEFPRWSNGDYASVGVLLSEVSTLRVRLAAQRDLLQEVCDAAAAMKYECDACGCNAEATWTGFIRDYGETPSHYRPVVIIGACDKHRDVIRSAFSHHEEFRLCDLLRRIKAWLDKGE
jgi:hypothetical protein